MVAQSWKGEQTMICTCDACHYTFYADTLPFRCPDCGKEQIHRRVSERIIPSPAVRVATGEETAWFENVQRELSSENNLERLSDGMTGDEYNWSLIMLFLHPMPKTRDARLALASYLSAIRQDSERAFEMYPTIRRMFTQKINADRAALKEADIAEPVIMPAEKERIEHWNAYGSALRVLYQFKPDTDAHPFLNAPPNLGNVRRIDLKKIAFEPTAAYLQFLLDWENSLFDAE